MPVSEEQKERKNQMRRLNRARKKQLISPEEPQEPKEEAEEAKEEPEEAKEEPQEPKEDAEVIRKRAIADKRRASLALARSKIKPKSQITRDKDIEIAQIKEENTRLKELAIKPVIPEVVAKKAVRQRPKKEEYEQPIQQPSMDYLVNQSYAEQLQKRLKENMHNRLMSDTFM